MSHFRFESIRDDAHRPWPVPEGRWLMRQTWTDLLFAHWCVPAERLRAAIPPGLSLELYDGMAWIGVVPFQMSNVSVRALPNVPHLSAFPELNVRTYVTRDNKPGVWFFSLDAARLAAVIAARVIVGLPYYWASMSCVRNDGVTFSSRRRGGWRSRGGGRSRGGNGGDTSVGDVGRGDGQPALNVSYRATGSATSAVPGSLEYFLTERYCLYTAGSSGLKRLEIQHPPWALRAAEASWRANTMLEPLGLSASEEEPLLHCAERQDVVAWGPKKC